MVTFDPVSSRKIDERWFVGGECVRVTKWRTSGSVLIQIRLVDDNGESIPKETNRAPPWLWGVTDQTHPTMPAWMKDDEQWQAALDAQGD